MLKRLVSGLLAASLLFPSSALVAMHADTIRGKTEEQKSDFYKQLLPYFIDGKQQKEKTTSTIITNKSDAPAPKPKAVDVTLRELGSNEQAQMVLELCGHAFPTPAVDRSIIDPLEKFMVVTSDTRNIVTRLMPHSTLWGKVAFARDCTRTFGYSELLQRQSVTRFFAENSDARKKAARALDLIRSGQRAYLAYFEQLDETTKHVLESVYFNNTMLAPLNTSKAALAVSEAGRWLQLSIAPALYSGLTMVLIGQLSKAGVNALGTYGNANLSRWEKVKETLTAFARIPDRSATETARKMFYSHWPRADKEYDKNIDNLAATIRSDEEQLYATYRFLPKEMQQTIIEGLSEGDKDSIARNLARASLLQTHQSVESVQDSYQKWSDIFFGLKKPGRVLAFGFSYGYTATCDALLFWSLQTAASSIAQTNSIYTNYQTRLTGVANIVRGLTMLADITRSIDSAALGTVAEDIEIFLDAAGNNDLAALLDALETDTFTGSPSFFSNRPRILVTNRLMEQCKELFVRPLAAAGELELFVNAAEFYAQHQTTDTIGKPVCFVEFVDDAEPRLEFKNGWNILVPEKQAVCIDSMVLGKNGVHNAIFTGPNGTGKSTNENAIAGIYFTSKFGIACASHAIATPFEVFEVHRNELEDVTKGMSTFMAQKARFDDICERIGHLGSGRMIIFMDEPLNGTVEDEAGRIIYDKCSQLLAKQKQAICIIATHAAQPTRLESDTNGAFKNFYVEVFEREPGFFERTYKLRRGVLTQWFEDPEWRHRFVEWLSKEKNPSGL